MKAVLVIIILLMVGGLIIQHFVTDAEIVEAHEATVEAMSLLSESNTRNEELKDALEPKIAELKVTNQELLDSNRQKDREIGDERRKRIIAQSEKGALERQLENKGEEVVTADSQELVAITLELIAESYPEVTGETYAVRDDTFFVGNRASADAFALGLTEVLISRQIRVSQRDENQALTNEIRLSDDQKANLEAALKNEEEAHFGTSLLLISERQLNDSNFSAIEAQRTEIEAYEKKIQFDWLAPKVSIGLLTGIGIDGRPMAGIGLSVGWVIK